MTGLLLNFWMPRSLILVILCYIHTCLQYYLLIHITVCTYSKYEVLVKVVRVCLDSGERLIGFQYPALLMNMAEKESKLLAQENKVCLK